MYVDSGHNHLGIKGVFNYDEIPSNKTLSELGFSKRFIIKEIEFSEIFFINKIDNSFDEYKEKYSIDLLNHVLIYFRMDLNLLWG